MNFIFKNKLEKMNYFGLILVTFIIIYFLILVATYVFQRNLLYHPKENNYSGDQLNVSIEKITYVLRRHCFPQKENAPSRPSTHDNLFPYYLYEEEQRRSSYEHFKK